MSYSFTATETKTFTLTHARHLAAKVAADLKRLQRLYGHITDERIGEFEGEVTELLRQGYLGTVTYGFQRDEKWIEPTLRYTANELADSGTDDDPGRVPPGKNISGARFHSYLTYSAAWDALTADQRAAVKAQLPLQRVSGSESAVSNGHLALKLEPLVASSFLVVTSRGLHHFTNLIVERMLLRVREVIRGINGCGPASERRQSQGESCSSRA